MYILAIIVMNCFAPKQGPALYAYNNAQFTKDDWKGIRMLCDSIKVKDPMKVGRFGLGFKSVFHMTGRYTTLCVFLYIAEYRSRTCMEYCVPFIVSNLPFRDSSSRVKKSRILHKNTYLGN